MAPRKQSGSLYGKGYRTEGFFGPRTDAQAKEHKQNWMVPPAGESAAVVVVVVVPVLLVAASERVGDRGGGISGAAS